MVDTVSPFPEVTDEVKVLARARSRYNDLLVLQNGSLRELWFHGGGRFYLQSKVDLKALHRLVLIYSRMSMASLLFCPDPRRILMVGLGAGVLGRFFHHYFPKVQIDVVEIDPRVIDFARRFFHLKEDHRHRVHAGDGRLFLKNRTVREPYDMVFLDAFKSGSVPFHLKTLEFYREIAGTLTEAGLVVSNLYGKSNSLKPRDCKTLASVFPWIYCLEDPDRVATVAIATRQAEGRSLEILRRRARSRIFQNLPGISMPDIADMFIPAPTVAKGEEVFRDDFRERDLLKRIARNNRNDSGIDPPYPILSSG